MAKKSLKSYFMTQPTECRTCEYSAVCAVQGHPPPEAYEGIYKCVRCGISWFKEDSEDVESIFDGEGVADLRRFTGGCPAFEDWSWIDSKSSNFGRAQNMNHRVYRGNGVWGPELCFYPWHGGWSKKCPECVADEELVVRETGRFAVHMELTTETGVASAPFSPTKGVLVDVEPRERRVKRYKHVALSTKDFLEDEED